MEAGTNLDLQAGASISGVALGSTLSSEGVAGGLNSVPVDEEVMNLDDDGEEPSSVVVVCKRQEMDPNVVFTIKLRQDYEKRSGQVASGGNVRDADDVLDICVSGSLDLEEESQDWSWTGYGENLRMENVVQRLYV
ncbi:hypothetical protein HDU80_004917 [Chytriomyces hyalinus]|nr:hypothetical protein HDU80_004917 [Chytriomyces hyalinus]